MKYFLHLNLVISMFMLCILPSLAQDEESTMITDTNGNQITIPPEVEYVIENPQEENRTFILTPKEGVTLATTQIKRGDETTKISGKKIIYTPINERFLLENDAMIETASEILKGPKLIQFDPDKNFMLVEGTDQKWAEFRYQFPDGRVMHSFGKTFKFYFETVDGKRKLKRIEKS